jgi:molybdopterin-containing oxidoreductase family membrane subunit
MKEYAEIVIEAILFGFGVYSIIFLIVRPMLSDSKKAILDKFDNSACLVAAIVGAFYLAGGLTSLIIEYTTVKKQVEGFTMKDRLFGQYWIWYWIQPTFYLFCQLLWFKKIRKMKFVRFIVALLLITSIESLVIYLTSIHRDYLPSSWSTPISARIMDWLISLGLFGATTILFHLIKTKLKVDNTQ